MHSHDAEIHNSVLTPLRAKCPNLRAVYFGYRSDLRSETSDQRIVHLSQTDRPGDPAYSAVCGEGGDEIWWCHGVNLGILDGPPTPSRARNFSYYPLYPPLDLPCVLDTVRPFYDVWLDTPQGHDHSVPLPPALVRQWHDALLSAPYFARLHRSLRFDQLPISLRLIGDLCERQSTVKSPFRICEIEAPRIDPWDLSELRPFAAIMGSSLTFLTLGHSGVPRWGPYSDERVKVSFSDLPELISIIRSSLRSLRSLDSAMKGIESAEADCKHMLHDRCLEPGGTLEMLSLRTADESHGNVYNIIRVLSQICDEEAHILIGLSNAGVGGADDLGDWGRVAQRGLLYELRK